MSDRTITLETIDLPATADLRDGKRNILRIDLDYTTGGQNYFSGGTIPRGYTVRMSREQIGDGSRTFMIGARGHHRAFVVESAARFNAKKLAQLAATVTQHERYEPMKAEMIAAVTEAAQ